jgi:hypothetical protein
MLGRAQLVLTAEPGILLEIRKDRAGQRHVVLPQVALVAFCGTPVIRAAKKQVRVRKRRSELAGQPYLCTRCVELVGK